jgi:dynactin-4
MTPYKFGSTFLRSPLPAATATAPKDESGTAPPQERQRPPFAITLPTFAFSIAAFTKAWEHDGEDEDDMVEDEHADLVDDRRHASTSSRSVPGRGGKVKIVGVLEKKANMTYIGGEVVIGKEAKGDVKV